MGSNVPLQFNTISQAEEKKYHPDPEEYILDTYLLPSIPNPKYQGPYQTSRKPHLKKPKEPRKISKPNVPCAPEDSLEDHQNEEFEKTGMRDVYNGSPTPKRKLRHHRGFGNQKEQENSKNIAPSDPHQGYVDESAHCSSLACNGGDKKNCQNERKARFDWKPSKKGEQKFIRPNYTKVHKIPFLKTVSIIDTLSELGPDVKQLAEELPKISSKGSSTSKETKTTSSASLPPDNHDLGTVQSNHIGYSQKKYDKTVQNLDEDSYITNKLRINATTNSKQVKGHYQQNGNQGKGDSKQRSMGSLPKHKRDRGRTPDWIKKIFKVSKKGDLEALKEAIFGMEETLVRNLSDHSGNNLLHIMSIFGHLAPLIWLLTTHALLLDALQDENKNGLTPVVCSIKYGRLHILQWLVNNTFLKEKMKNKQRERSLLHLASKYSQVEIVSWLVDYMMSLDISLDNIDHHGNTSLHLAARTGNSRLCSILLQNGADVTLKNDIGQKAWEVCIIRGHLACAEYLCVHESGLALAADLTRAEAELEAAITDNQDLRINFKEVMNIARRLIREREEVMKELSRLQDSMTRTHASISGTGLEYGENSFSNDSVENFDDFSDHRQYNNLASHVKTLHTKWQYIQKTWLGSSLVNTKHKMLLMEESWKKLRQRDHRTVATTHHPLDVFRSKLCSIRAQGGEGSFGDYSSIRSSEESLESLFPLSDDDESLNLERNFIEPTFSTPKSACDDKSFMTSKYSHSDALNTPYSHGMSSILDSSFHDSLLMNTKRGNSLFDKEGNVYQKSSKPVNGYDQSKYIDDPTGLYSIGNANKNFDYIESGDDPRKSIKKDLSSQLKELTLISDSGSCSVIEVIEPSSGESNLNLDEDNYSFVKNRSTNRKMEDENICGEDNSYLKEKSTIASTGGLDNSYNKNGKAKHFLADEAFTDAAAVDVFDSKQRLYTREEELDDRRILDPNTDNSINGTYKRKGFLQKLLDTNVWNSKRKTRTVKPTNFSILSEPINSSANNNEFKSTNKNFDPRFYDKSDIKDSSSQQNVSTQKEKASCSFSDTSSHPSEQLLSSTYLPINETFNDKSPLLAEEDSSSETFSPHILPLPPLDPSCSRTPPPLPLPRSNTLSNFTSESKSLPLNCEYEEVPELQDEDNSCLKLSENAEHIMRPASSASKSGSISQPGSFTYSFRSFKNHFQLQKSSLSLNQDMLPTPECSLTGRMSPAPSEVSKTESALSPPSHMSDISKSESSRQVNQVKCSNSKDGADLSSEMSNPCQPVKEEDLTVKSAVIMQIPKDNNNSEDTNALSADEGGNRQCQKKHRPWYEVSDEESDILLPDRLTNTIVPHHSSSEDDVEVC